MIEKAKLQAVTKLVVHDSCADGLLSAIILKDVLPYAAVEFSQYGTRQEAIVPEPNMLFCDFSPHALHVQEFVDAGAIVLDHHKTAKQVVERFGVNGVYADEAKEPGVCGSTLAYREVWLQLAADNRSSALIERLVRRAGVRDTWQRQDPDWFNACEQSEALQFYRPESWYVPNTFDAANDNWWDNRLSIGRRLIERRDESVRAAIGRGHRFTSARGTRVIMFTGVRLSSDAAESLGDSQDLVAAFDYAGREDGLIDLIYSTRSHTGFDCAAFCKRQGGGGHTAAAGFTVTFRPSEARDPFSLFAAALSDWEAARRDGGADGQADV